MRQRIWVVTCCFLAVAVDAAPTATVLNGTYTGVNLPQLSQDVFWGVPFAQQSRFEQATPLNETWQGSRNATVPGLTCAGYGTNTQEDWPIGEDCLNLNVVRPQGVSPGSDLPVLIWMYGGGYRQGSNRDPEFNTSFLVQTSVEIAHPVIVVSINYRLSAFGFIASEEAARNGALDLGLQDQRQALRWVKENIRAFGGDPNRVTIWGESAGAQSVAFQVMAYGGDSQGLFRGAIMASGSFFGFGQNRAVDTFQCLKALPFEQLNRTVFGQNEGQYFVPVIDGDLLRSYPIVAFNNGRLPPINIIVGGNSDEGMSLGVQTTANTSTELAAFLEQTLGVNSTLANQLLDLYPANASAPPFSVPMDYPWQNATASVGLYPGNQTRRSYTIATDKNIMAGRRKAAHDWAGFGGQAYSYRWDTDPSRFPIVLTPGLGPGFAQRGAELSYVFRLPYISGTPYPPLPNVTAMRKNSYAMQAAWVSFAATGSPNHHGLNWVPHWPAYDNGSQNFVFNATLNDTLNLHLEADDFRAEGIAWMNSRWTLLNP